MYVRWQQELKCWLLRIHSEPQLGMMLIKFKTACPDCMQTEVTGADEWDAAMPRRPRSSSTSSTRCFFNQSSPSSNTRGKSSGSPSFAHSYGSSLIYAGELIR